MARGLAGSLLVLGACATVPPLAQPQRPTVAPVALSAEPPAWPQVQPVVRRPALHGPAVAAEDTWELAASDAAESGPEPALLALAAQGPGPQYKPQHSLGSSRLLIGSMALDEDYWRPSESHLAVGTETSFERLIDWVGGEGGLFFSMEDERNTFGDTVIGVDMILVEAYFGLHRTFLRESRLRPYVGAGGSIFWVTADQEIGPVGGPYPTDDENEFALGLYAHGGLSWQLGEDWQIGVDYRWVASTDVDVLAGDEGDVGYTLFSVFIGFGG